LQREQKKKTAGVPGKRVESGLAGSLKKRNGAFTLGPVRGFLNGRDHKRERLRWSFFEKIPIV